MSLLDKINDSISEVDNNKESDTSDNKELQNQVNTLKAQLDEANKINKKNHDEINELKNLINNYDSQIENLKNSYNNNIQNLKAQIDFEKEINEKYLTKLVESNNNLNKNIKDYNDKTSKENQELKSLMNENNSLKDENNSQEMDELKGIIAENNDNVIKLINNLKEESASSNKELINHVTSQENNLSKIISSNNSTNMEQLLNEINETISQNKAGDNTISENINEIKSLINTNKEELNLAANNIINEVSNNSELINTLNNNYDTTKIEILNRISDDLSNENYVNLYAYKKIKELNLFDETYYIRTYDYNCDIDPLLHYIYKGYQENKKPSEDFNPLTYKESSNNVKESTLNPLVYFVTKGIREGDVKINDDIREVKHININDVNQEIENFNIRGVKKSKRKPRIIVSLTSVPEHLHNLHYTLYSLLNQQLKSDKVILWLNKSDYPNNEIDLPKEILKLKQNGLSIRFCDDYKEYNNIIPVLNNYPNDILVTANDNIYYPNDWLKILYEDYKQNPDSIIAHKSRIISGDDQNISDYATWPLNTDQYSSSYNNFISNEAGVLYPPRIFYEDVCNYDAIKESSSNIDVWLWAMAVLNHKKIKIAENKLDDNLIYVDSARELNLLNDNNDNTSQNVNENIKYILNKYPEITNIINEE